MNLPNDCLMEILSWLPAKKTIILKTVNKNFFHLISNSFFNALQARHVKSTNAGILMNRHGWRYISEVLFFDQASNVPPDSMKILSRKMQNLLGSFNGLIFFEGNDYRLYVFNPVTKTIAEIPSPPNVQLHINATLFSRAMCVSSDNGEEFEMIFIARKKNLVTKPHLEEEEEEPFYFTFECMSYSSKYMSWEYIAEIDLGERNIIAEDPVFVNGYIYFLSTTAATDTTSVHPYILAFHVDKRKSEFVPLPEQVQKLDGDSYEVRIAPSSNNNTDGQLCLIQYIKKERVVVWVMMCHSSASSSSSSSSSLSSQGFWRKVHEVDIITLGLGEVDIMTLRFGEDRDKEIGNYILIDGKLLVFSVSMYIYTYDFVEGSLNKVGKHKQGERPRLNPYANTLHSCGKFEQQI
ncbi:uncharacterized protein LOC120277638 [Dioscorea cayenensis subsp. rotundata]|uniref:Uncharacterized protein LOC120277638 n=1 Tax=Dioscorea cayennensis subsp. rotundata TaxID=55577 RepID=A0AB40CQL0_DIOCR|nr:uncharacterized protein LOC120277638 [Dioscorea cayenensis subsp. rotundata]